MKKSLYFFLLLVLGLWSMVYSSVLATKSTYVYTDRRYQSVKRVEVDADDLKDRQINQPYTFSELQLREMLSALKFDKKALFNKNEETDEVIFNQPALDLLVPNLAKAFQEAQPNEEVIFSFVTHKPKVLMRDDRLTIAKSWIEGNQLHIHFKKLMAKISNDYDKMSDVNIAISKAQGVRVSILIQPGQQFGKSTDEVLLAIPPAESGTIDHGPLTVDQKKLEKPATEKAKPVSVTTATPPLPTNTNATEGRLQQLDSLKKKGLINKDEYQKKREEILNSL